MTTPRCHYCDEPARYRCTACNVPLCDDFHAIFGVSQRGADDASPFCYCSEVCGTGATIGCCRCRNCQSYARDLAYLNDRKETPWPT